jgi:hypothetical protein
VVDPFNSSTVYAGTVGAGVYRSLDGGGTWSAYNAGLPPEAYYVFGLTIDPSTGKKLYACRTRRPRACGRSRRRVRTGRCAATVIPAPPSTRASAVRASGVRRRAAPPATPTATVIRTTSTTVPAPTIPTSRDSDGDGTGDLCDPCPMANPNTCDPQQDRERDDRYVGRHDRDRRTA